MTERRIEGRNPVLEALSAGVDLREILLAEGAEASGPAARIRREAARRGVPVRTLPRREIDRLAVGRAQGVIALAPEFAYGDLEQVLSAARLRGEPPLVLALDGVTDPHNLGALARSAHAAGAHGMVLPRRRSASVTPAAEKAAAGALSHLPVVQVGNLPRALEDLRQRGLWVVALDAHGGRRVWDLDLATEPVCLVVGAEGPGVSRLVRERSDVLASVPMSGGVGSLNVSVAGGIALFEIVRRRFEDPGRREGV